MGAASEEPADKNTAPATAQLIAVVLSNIIIRPLEHWLILRAAKYIEHIAEEVVRHRSLTAAQKAVLSSPVFNEWFQAGLSFREFTRLNKFQLKTLSKKKLVKVYLESKILTKDEILAISAKNHRNLLGHSLFSAKLSLETDIYDKKAFVRNALSIPPHKIHLGNLENRIVKDEVIQHSLAVLIAIQLKPHHINALRDERDKFWAILQEDPTGNLLLQQQNIDDIIYTANYITTIHRPPNP